MTRRLTLIALALAVACGASDADPPGVTADADPNAPDADPNAPDAGPDAPDAAPAASFPACYLACDTAADCDFGNPVNDPNNYACTGGLCIYRGCNNTQECVDTFMSNDYACGTVPGIATPTCLLTCDVAADCATTGSAAFDADNYACTGGLCEYTGCNGDTECTDAFGAGYGCHQRTGFSYPTCLARCTTAGDCAIANGGSLYDADNYSCPDGFCRWDGCNATAECTDSLMDARYVCEAP